MTTMGNARPRGDGRGAGGEQVGQTGSQSTRLPDAWHEQCEWENAASYAHGYADGYAAAERAIAEEIRQATGVRPYSSRAVIKWLCRSIDLDQRTRRAEPYASPENGMTLGVAGRDVIGRWAA